MMLNQEEKAYYDRHLRLPGFGEEAQMKLQQAKVLVVGAGGLGCPVLQYLSASGVGTLVILDDDTVSISNLQRQVLFSIEDLNQPKAQVASTKLSALNPNIQVVAHQVRLTKENALNFFEQVDIIVDCSDNFATRYLVNDAAILSGKPFVYGALGQFDGQVSVFNYNNGPTYRCLFPEMPNPEDFPSCSDLGVLGVVPGIIGSLQALECIKLITGIGKVLSGELLLYSGLQQSFMKLKINANETAKCIYALGDYAYGCDFTVQQIAFEDLTEEHYLVDVREAHEHAAGNLGGVNIPLGELETRKNELKDFTKIVCYCKSGQRSKKAVEILSDQPQIYSLTNGIDGLTK